MKNIFLVILFIPSICFGHKSFQFEHEFENLYLYSSTEFITEEVNSNIIIGEYTNLLLKESFNNQKVKLFLHFGFDFKYYAGFGDKNESDDERFTISIWFNKIDIEKKLNLILYFLENQEQFKNNKQNKEKIFEKFNADLSTRVSELMNHKIVRPQLVSKLNALNNFNYYFQNGCFNITSNKYNQEHEIIRVKNLYQISTPTYEDLFLITEGGKHIYAISCRYNYELLSKSYNPKIQLNKLDFCEIEKSIFKPYIIRLLGKNKFTIEEAYWGDEVYLYFKDKNILIRNLDKLIDN